MPRGIPRPDEIIEKSNIAYLIVIISTLAVVTYFIEIIGQVLLALIILTIPGYCFLYAILVDVDTDMDGIQIAGLSIVMSMVVLIFVALNLAFLHLLEALYIRIAVFFVTLVFLMVGYLRGKRVVDSTD